MDETQCEYRTAVYRLAEMIGARANLKVDVKRQKGVGLGFWVSGKKFAQINPLEYCTVIYAGAKKEFAVKARVADLAQGELKKGWYGADDELYWHTGIRNDDRLREIAGILSRICQAR